MADEILNQEEPEEVTTPTNEDPEPTPPTIFDKVKLALRISHNLLDGEITEVITSARQEMIRAGVKESVANEGLFPSNGLYPSDILYPADDTPFMLVETAIKTYALEYFTRDTKEKEGYAESFKYQLDNLRKTYPAEVS